MAEILRDPIWQFIGAFLGLVAIGVSIYLFLLQKSKKSLSYRIETKTSLLTVDDEIEGKLQVVYEGSPVRNVYLLVLRIIADGNVPIASSDFEQPLSFTFGDTAKVLSAEIVTTNPKTLSPKLSVVSNSVTLEPTLLNIQDSVTVKVLVAEYEGELVPRARIFGAKEIRNISGNKTPLRERVVVFIAGVLFWSMIFFLVPPALPLNTLTAFVVIGMSVLITIVYGFTVNRAVSRRERGSN